MTLRRALSAFFVATTAATLLFAAPALACSCAAPSEASGKTAYYEMDYVIEGEVVTASDRIVFGRSPMLKVVVKREFRGDLPDREATFFYNPNLSACGNTFKPGDTVIFGAFKSDENMPRVANSCAQYAIRHYLDIHHGYPEAQKLK